MITKGSTYEKTGLIISTLCIISSLIFHSIELMSDDTIFGVFVLISCISNISVLIYIFKNKNIKTK